MKNTYRNTVSIMLLIALLMSITSCGNGKESEDLWKNATYTENAEIGKGDKTLTIKVSAGDKAVTITVYTDKETLGDALTECDLISGENGPYGLYVKTVNGIYADYDTTKAYWALNKIGAQNTLGVDSEKISDGDQFEFKYTKE